MNSFNFGLNGLRAIAALCVLAYHTNTEIFHYGYIGVDIFFVISGYLFVDYILPLTKERYSPIEFLRRRIRRILPVLVFVVGTVVFSFWLYALPHALERVQLEGLSALFFLSNIYLHYKTGYFSESARLDPFVHTWSLSAEFQIYLLIPIFYYLGGRIGTLRYLFVFVAIVFSISFFMMLLDVNNKWYYSPATRFWQILLGAIVHSLVRKFNYLDSCKWLIIILLFPILLVTGYYILYNTVNPSAVITLIVAFVLLVADRIGNAWAIRSGPVQLIGRLSYSLYCWHQPILVGAFLLFGYPLKVHYLILTYTLIGVSSYISYHYIEYCLHESRHSERPKNNLLFFGITVICAASYLVSVLYTRWPESVIRGVHISEGRYTYVWKNHNSRRTPINWNSPKILVIGDSSSADLINAILSTNKVERGSLASIKIGYGCGNFPLDSISDVAKLRNLTKADCNDTDDVNNPKIRSFIKEADIILLSSLWFREEAVLAKDLVDSYKRVNNSAKIMIVGSLRTDFSPLRALRSYKEFQIVTAQAVDIEINSMLAAKLVGNIFIDPYDLLCDNSVCIINNGKEWLFADGSHLTPDGVRLYGRALISNPTTSSLFRAARLD